MGSTPSSGSEDAPKFADRLVARAVGSTSHERQYETTASRTAVLGSSLCQGGSTGQPAATFRLIGLWAQPFERLRVLEPFALRTTRGKPLGHTPNAVRGDSDL